MLAIRVEVVGVTHTYGVATRVGPSKKKRVNGDLKPHVHEVIFVALERNERRINNINEQDTSSSRPR
jgi:hypothetical protein